MFALSSLRFRIQFRPDDIASLAIGHHLYSVAVVFRISFNRRQFPFRIDHFHSLLRIFTVLGPEESTQSFAISISAMCSEIILFSSFKTYRTGLPIKSAPQNFLLIWCLLALVFCGRLELTPEISWSNNLSRSNNLEAFWFACRFREIDIVLT